MKPDPVEARQPWPAQAQLDRRAERPPALQDPRSDGQPMQRYLADRAAAETEFRRLIGGH